MFTLVGPSLTAQVSGGFLVYDHGQYFTGQPDCWGCSYNYLPIVAIQIDTCCKNSLLYLAAYDSNGARFSPPVGLSAPAGSPFGSTQIQNSYWYGTTAPAWMGFTSPSWHFGRVGWVSVIGASYNLTACNYQGEIELRIKAFVWTPGITDTTYFDSAVFIPFCMPLSLPPILPPVTGTEIVDTIESYNVLGQYGKGYGLTCLLLYSEKKGYHYKKIYLK